MYSFLPIFFHFLFSVIVASTFAVSKQSSLLNYFIRFRNKGESGLRAIWWIIYSAKTGKLFSFTGPRVIFAFRKCPTSRGIFEDPAGDGGFESVWFFGIRFWTAHAIALGSVSTQQWWISNLREYCIFKGSLRCGWSWLDSLPASSIQKVYFSWTRQHVRLSADVISF